jgi:hypothetical protein
MTQKRLLILGAVLIATGVGTPVLAILANGSGAERPRPSATEEFLEASPEPDLFADVTQPPVVDMDRPAPADAGDRDGRVPPGSGARTLAPADAPPPVTPGPLPESAAAPGPATPDPAGTTTLSTPPAELEPRPGVPIPLPAPVPLPGPEETTATGMSPPPLPEDDER